MPLSRFVEISGQRYRWRDLLALRQAQAEPKVRQLKLFALREDCRLAGDMDAPERYRKPSLFTLLDNAD